MKDASQMMSFKETGHDLTFEKRSDNDFCLVEVGWGWGAEREGRSNFILLVIVQWLFGESYISAGKNEHVMTTFLGCRPLPALTL